MSASLDRSETSDSDRVRIMKLWQQFLRPTCFAVLGASLLSQSAFAQFSSNTATRTTTGGTGTAGSSGFNTGASGGGGSSGSMFGNSNSSGQGANSNGVGPTTNAQSRQINTQSQLGLNQSNFLGQGNNQQNFLGRNQRTQTQNNQQNRQNNNNNRGQGNFGQNDNNQNGQGQQNQDPKRAIRPQLRVAFVLKATPTTEIRTLPPRFDSLSQTPALRGVAYELDTEGVVVLRGTVDTLSQRRLAENVVKLEPGVKKVRNELTLNEPAATK